MSAGFTLCSECLAAYRALRPDPEATCLLNIMPTTSLMWSDEHPGGARELIETRVRIETSGVHAECGKSILRLMRARTALWRTGVVPDTSRIVWEEARQVLADWPGFQRLTLTPDQHVSLDACRGEAEEVLAAIARLSSEVTMTFGQDGVTSVSATRMPSTVSAQAPWWSHWLERIGGVLTPIVAVIVVILVILSLVDYFGFMH